MLLSLGYAQLLNALREARRKWKVWRRAEDKDKALLKASVECTKNGTLITNVAVIDRLRIAFRKLGITNSRIRILVEGEVKAAEMLRHYREKGLFSWAPQLNMWLRDQAYKFWLGTLQITRENLGCLMVGVELG